MQVIIDRLEGHFAVCEKEDGNIINIEVKKLPSKAKEGDVLNINENVITIDSKKTEELRKQCEDMCSDIWDE